MAKPVKRLRDQQRFFKPQQKVTFQEWEQITNRAASASAFFKETNLVYLTMKQSLEDATVMITHNRIREVREEHSISDTFKKIFITPKKIQDDQTVGQIILIENLFKEVQSWIDLKEDLEQKEALGVISIERNTNA